MVGRRGPTGFGRNASACETGTLSGPGSMARAVVMTTGRSGRSAARGEQIGSAHMRKIDIGEHQIPGLVRNPLERDDRVGDMDDVEAAALAQHVPGEASGRRISLDDKDASPAGGWSNNVHTCRLLLAGSRPVSHPVAGRLQESPRMWSGRSGAPLPQEGGGVSAR